MGDMAAPDYSIRSLCYAHCDLPADFCGGTPIHSLEGTAQLAMHYVLLSSQGDDGQTQHVLVDCGFDQAWIPRFGFYDWQPPETVLGRVGVQTSDVGKIMFSHMHFDHMNALGHFPDVDIVVTEREFEGWVERTSLPEHYYPMGEQSWMLSSFDRSDLDVMRDRIDTGRVAFNGDGEEVLPGVTAFFSGAHSPGNQWFSVQTGNGPFVVAQDAVYWYSNIEEMWPSGYTNGDTYGMVRGYGAIYEHLNGEIDRIVPGHEMKIYERFPSWEVEGLQIAEVNVASWDTSLKPA
jgi:glyoxylase-like metal-dependent hydrolase (beta-lactamase superfamily II)